MTQDQLNVKFTDEGWGARLAAWTRVPLVERDYAHGPRVRERGAKYRDQDGNTRAIIFDYTHDDGRTVRAVRMLRDDTGHAFNAEV